MRLRTVKANINRSVGDDGDLTSFSFKVALDDTLDRLDLETGEVARSPASYIYIDLKEPNPDLFVEISRESRGRAPIDKDVGKVGTVHYTEAWDSDDESCRARSASDSTCPTRTSGDCSTRRRMAWCLRHSTLAASTASERAAPTATTCAGATRRRPYSPSTRPCGHSRSPRSAIADRAIARQPRRHSGHLPEARPDTA